MTTLGNKYRDRVTGFTGVATGRAEYISGCTQVLLAPPTAEDGSHRDSQWWDEQRLEELPGKTIVLNNSATPGPDKQAPKR